MVRSDTIMQSTTLLIIVTLITKNETYRITVKLYGNLVVFFYRLKRFCPIKETEDTSLQIMFRLRCYLRE